MNLEYIKENYIFEKLTEEHNLEDFDCESEDLTDFLKNDALKQQKMHLNLTHLVVCDGAIIGFVSILTDAVKLKIIDDKEAKIEIIEELNISGNNLIPAIKIGRFAIDKRYSNKGLGQHIFRNILLSILDISDNIVGLRFITLEAYARTCSFYVDKNKFKYLTRNNDIIRNIETIKQINPERTIPLYIDLKNIKT